ncbi:uncharacterized protein [Dysidea avara]|uniref:uncharacterized protein isoform X2 n=1 Tax=Dysidea avara TaxID=196820 RepID=UPI0033340ADD
MASSSQRDSNASVQPRPVKVILTRNDRRVECNVEQVTTENLRKMFQVQPTDAWLRDECDDSVYFSDQVGSFDLHSLSPYCTLIVEGPTNTGRAMTSSIMASTARGLSSVPAAAHGSSQNSLGVSVAAQSASLPPYFRSVTAAKKPVHLVKVVKAKMTASTKKGGKPDFTSTGQTYLPLTESTATVANVCDQVKRQWGTEYTVVSSDGLEIEDCVATQSLAFWRSPRRKLYAVSHSDFQEMLSCPSRSSTSSFTHHSDSSDDDDDKFSPPKGKKGRYEKLLKSLKDEVISVKETVSDAMSLTPESVLPLGLRRIIRDTFKCQICHTIPVQPPVIVTKCCKNILGCQVCVDTWYSGPEAMRKTCPMCRAERGCNETMILRGLSDFMEACRRIDRNQLQETSENAQEEEN